MGTVPRYCKRLTLIIRGLELGTMESGNYHRGVCVTFNVCLLTSHAMQAAEKTLCTCFGLLVCIKYILSVPRTVYFGSYLLCPLCAPSHLCFYFTPQGRLINIFELIDSKNFHANIKTSLTT